MPFLSTDFGRRAFSYSSPATWNLTPISIKKLFLPIQFQSPPHLTARLIIKKHTPPGHLATAHASNSCLLLDYVHVINFLLILIITSWTRFSQCEMLLFHRQELSSLQGKVKTLENEKAQLIREVFQANSRLYVRSASPNDTLDTTLI